ncbi:hypothetical protein CEV33_2426 [Brucella grignonensis]|uniref:Uncharacterized protein n=1 Tax=Brucella grignonensis TaxID=94627 RepID=A0A256F886_9HYPH|nr:hypothetical protein CEV33_2426 [Brucella grignonensis]
MIAGTLPDCNLQQPQPAIGNSCLPDGLRTIAGQKTSRAGIRKNPSPESSD